MSRGPLGRLTCCRRVYLFRPAQLSSHTTTRFRRISPLAPSRGAPTGLSLALALDLHLHSPHSLSLRLAAAAAAAAVTAAAAAAA